MMPTYPEPSARPTEQPCFRSGRGSRRRSSRSRGAGVAAALHREEAGEADNEEVEGADGHLSSEVWIETRASRSRLKTRQKRAKRRNRKTFTFIARTRVACHLASSLCRCGAPVEKLGYVEIRPSSGSINSSQNMILI